FARMARAWTASPGAVPRLGILLPFSDWVALAERARADLRPLESAGVTVEIFYAEQAELGGVAPGVWQGRVVHNVSSVIRRLLMHWQPPPIWPLVIDALAGLVHTHTRPADAPRLLAHVAALSLSCGGAVQAAALAREALCLLPETPSRRRSR